MVSVASNSSFRIMICKVGCGRTIALWTLYIVIWIGVRQWALSAIGIAALDHKIDKNPWKERIFTRTACLPVSRSVPAVAVASHLAS